MELPKRIEIRNDVMGGKPCIAGTRIPIYLLLRLLAAGETETSIPNAYPQREHADMQACLQYAAEIAAEESVIAI